MTTISPNILNKKVTSKSDYYSLRNALREGVKHNAKYYMIYGKRSNGKTYACKELGLNGYHDKEIDIKGYIQDGSQFAYVRRWQEDFKGKRGAVLFDDIVAQGKVKEWTNGKWSDIYFYSGRWYLAKFDEQLNKMVHDETPFAYAFSVSNMEHDKSTSYPKVNKIIFDEFLTRGIYLPDEFIMFMNCISTIVRDRDDIMIFMLGNTVNQYCPYFDEMGVDVKKLEQGTISVFKYGKNQELSMIVEYCAETTNAKRKSKSDVYFAFQNQKLNMITGGAWEMEIYPHAPIKWTPKDVKFMYFIVFGGDILQCEIIKKGKSNFTFIHRKTTPIQDDQKDLIYSSEYKPLPNWKRRITHPYLPVEKIIYTYFLTQQVYYQNNQIGEIVRNYLLWCNSEN